MIGSQESYHPMLVYRLNIGIMPTNPGSMRLPTKARTTVYVRELQPCETVAHQHRAYNLPDRAGNRDKQGVAKRLPKVDFLRTGYKIGPMKFPRKPFGRNLEHIIVALQRNRNHPEEGNSIAMAPIANKAKRKASIQFNRTLRLTRMSAAFRFPRCLGRTSACITSYPLFIAFVINEPVGVPVGYNGKIMMMTNSTHTSAMA